MNCANKILLCAIVGLASSSASGDGVGEWIKLYDGESTFGWTQFGDAPWESREGILTADSGSGGWLATTSQFSDFELEARVRVKAGCSSGIVVRAGLEGHPVDNGSTVIWLSEKKRSEPPWRTIHVHALGDSVTVTVDGKPVEVQPGKRARGYVGVLYHHNGRAEVEVAEMKLRPLAMQSLHNGKDLSGWNTIPGHPSRFQVVDGAINIIDGNGQIETEGVYKNFILQLDIISNGEHLNSGVFVRGIVGEFWTGYESQVRNQWRRDDRTKPIDYGTGGNYGNQPARKVLSSDGQWFQKTIVCDGNHMAVWIDGILVSDFHDTRRLNAKGNGKEGYLPGPGTIHLQGHDPTTDLSFKNIRLQTYPEN